jgi:1-acyl-sn-glycerol-3-phosphate acyltransferase
LSRLLRGAFFLLFVRPVLTIALGTHVRGREHLPVKGPAIVVANHNSHLDTLTIMAMFPMRNLPSLRPVAAMDYFMRSGPMAWFATKIIGIIPIVRGGHDKNADPLAPCRDALDRGDILILFPEGSRGEPEKLQAFKKGVAHLVNSRPDVPVYPLFMHGLGKALPKDSFLLVPFNCDVMVGEKLGWTGDVASFMETLQSSMTGLAGQIHMVPWD